MKTKMTYSDKLKDPRWQKKRLEILQRDNWTCQACEEKDNTFHVHHITYSKNPWETNNSHLITLCEDCHKICHALEKLPYDFCHIGMVIKLYDKIEIRYINECCREKGKTPYYDDPKFY